MTQETNNNVVKSLPQSTSSSSSSSGTKTKQNVYNKNEKNKNNENNEKRKSTTTTRSSHRVPKPEFMTRVSHLFDDLFLIFLLNFENFFHRLLFVNYHRQ